VEEGHIYYLYTLLGVGLKKEYNQVQELDKLKEQAVSQLKSLSQNKYTYPIESPNLQQHEQTSTFNQKLKKH